MSEATLRTEILIPLFKAMGFSDVFEYHGGPQEQGKDIVMWREDAGAVDRQNYSVVAKAQRITGKVEGGGGAGEVAVQVQQCFGRAYADPVSGQEQDVHRCFIVSSHEIKKEAVIAISRGLD